MTLQMKSEYTMPLLPFQTLVAQQKSSRAYIRERNELLGIPQIPESELPKLLEDPSQLLGITGVELRQ
jgi:hypothetical protein